MKYLLSAIIVILTIVISVVIIASLYTSPVIPRADVISDCGYSHLRRGWYDVQKQGVKNDYCRYVGPGAGVDHVWFSCQLAGAASPLTMPGEINVHPDDPHDDHDGSRGCITGGANNPLAP